jgi:hypothetical protein
MLERLLDRASALGRIAQKNAIARLIRQDLPPGITARVRDDAIILSGRGLIRRFINDPRIRRFGR